MTRFSIRSLAFLLLVAVGTATAASRDTADSTPAATEGAAETLSETTEESSEEPIDDAAAAADTDRSATETDSLNADSTALDERGEDAPEVSGFNTKLFLYLLIPVLFLAGAIVAFFWWRQRKTPNGNPTRAAPDFGQTISLPPVPGSSTTAAAGLASAKGEVEHLRDTVTRLETAVGSLSSRIDRLEQSASQPRQTAPTPSPPIAPPVTPTAGPMSADQKLAAGFVKWCRERGPLASKMNMFADYVGTAMPGATVEHVYRDLDSTVRPLRFGTNPGNAPADYWVVHVEGQSLLLPMPLGPAQFKDLNPAFEGSAVPQTLQTFVPARVQNEGGQYALVQPGRIG